MKQYKVSCEAFSIKFGRVEKVAVDIPGLVPMDVAFAVVSQASLPVALQGKLLVVGTRTSRDRVIVFVTCMMPGIETAFDRGAIELDIGVHSQVEEPPPTQRSALGACPCGIARQDCEYHR